MRPTTNLVFVGMLGLLVSLGLEQNARANEATNITYPEAIRLEPFEPRQVLVIEPDLVSPMVANTAISQDDAELALSVAKGFGEYYKEVFLLQMVTMKIESDFRHLDMNGTGDVGIMQLNKVTWDGHRKHFGADWNPYNRTDNIKGGTKEILQCAEKATKLHPEDWIRWTYIYYNRGKWVEQSTKWTDYNFRNTSFVRANKFKTYFDLYNEFLQIF